MAIVTTTSSGRRRARSDDDDDEPGGAAGWAAGGGGIGFHPPHHLFVDGGGKQQLQRHNQSLSVAICKDFARGRCSRSVLDCRYAHPPPTVAVEGDHVTVCYDSLRDRCARGLSCRYFHPPPHIRVLTQEAVGIDPKLGHELRASNLLLGPSPTSLVTITGPSIEVCRDFVRGRCKRDSEDCRFAHHVPATGDGEYAIVCQDFLRGRCERETCRYFHPPDHLRSRVKDIGAGSSASHRFDIPGLDIYGAYGGYENQAKRMRLDESLLERHHKSANMLLDAGGQSVRPSSPVRNDQDKLPVCRDFLRNKCARSSSCRFVHPAPYTQVVDGYVTLCRDSLRGRCRREACRFHHPLSATSASHRGASENLNLESSPNPDDDHGYRPGSYGSLSPDDDDIPPDQVGDD